MSHKLYCAFVGSANIRGKCILNEKRKLGADQPKLYENREKAVYSLENDECVVCKLKIFESNQKIKGHKQRKIT